MRISVRQLRRIIKESIAANRLHEGAAPGAVDDTITKCSADMMKWNRFQRHDFYHMAEGGDLDGARDTYYPGWADEDFQAVIIGVEGEYEP